MTKAASKIKDGALINFEAIVNKAAEAAIDKLDDINNRGDFINAACSTSAIISAFIIEDVLEPEEKPIFFKILLENIALHAPSFSIVSYRENGAELAISKDRKTVN